MSVFKLFKFPQKEIIERFRKSKWDEDEVNVKQVFIYDITPNGRREVWPVKKHENSLELIIYPPFKKSVISLNLLISSKNLIDVVDLIIKYQDSSKIADFCEELVAIKGTQVVNQQFFKRDEYSEEVNKGNLDKIIDWKSKKYIQVKKEEFNFYLGSIVDSKVFIKKENFNDLMKEIITDFREEAVEFSEEEISKLNTIEETIKFCWDDFLKIEFDKKGNISNIDVGHGGDVWFFHEFEKIAALIEDGSFILIQDDGFILWKVEYNAGEAVYFREVFI